jgi:PST family polysaccharide transporter
VIGAVVGIVLAIAGAGVWSLVVQNLVMESVALVLLWRLSTWRPGFRFSRRHARELLGFSTSVFAANLGGFVNRKADALLLGVFFGPVAVGLYRLADRFVEIVLELTVRPIGAVALPHFSRLQNDRDGLRDAVGSCLRTTVLATVPPLFVLAACSDQLMLFIGEQWEEAGAPLKLLAIVGMAKAFVFFTGPLLFAVSRPTFRAVMLWVFAGASVLVAAIAGVLLKDSSLADQVLGMSASRAALFVLVFVPVNWVIVSRLTGLRLADVLPSLPGPFASGLAALAAVAVLEATGLVDGLRPFTALVVVGAASVAAAAVTLVVVDPDARRRSRAVLAAIAGRAGGGEALPPTVDGEPSGSRWKN